MLINAARFADRCFGGWLVTCSQDAHRLRACGGISTHHSGVEGRWLDGEWVGRAGGGGEGEALVKLVRAPPQQHPLTDQYSQQCRPPFALWNVPFFALAPQGPRRPRKGPRRAPAATERPRRPPPTLLGVGGHVCGWLAGLSTMPISGALFSRRLRRKFGRWCSWCGVLKGCWGLGLVLDAGSRGIWCGWWL